MKVFGIVGWSGCECTGLMSKLLNHFNRRGIRVSAIKQSNVDGEWQSLGGETKQLHEAGCVETLMVSPGQWHLTHKSGDSPDGSIERILENMEDVDLVIIEGFKQMVHPKLLMVHPKKENQFENTQLLATACPHVEALVAVDPSPELEQLRLPIFSTDDISLIASFISSHCQLSLRAAVSNIGY